MESQPEKTDGSLVPDIVRHDDGVDPTPADPLLDCLASVARYYERGVPGPALIAGLPLPDGRLTPSFVSRAAARAGLVTKIVRQPLAKLSSLLLPAILLMDGENAIVLLERDDQGRATILLPETGHGSETVDVASLEDGYTGYAILLKPEYRFQETSVTPGNADKGNWFWSALSPLWPTYVQVLIVASVVNLLALAAPLFVMNIYDRVLPNKALSTLWVLAIGMLLAISFDFILRTVRHALIGNAGRRADVLLASRLFEHVLGMDLASRPLRSGEFANHLKDYEIVREFFTSSTLVTATDLLFIGLFIFVIYQIAGVVALVPAIAVVLVILVGLIIQVPVSHTVGKAQSESAHRHSLLFESLTGLETIRTSGAEGQLQRQWEQLVAQNARTSERLRFLTSLGTNMTSFLQQLVTVGVVVVGVYLFDQGEVSPGAIIAAVILSGRAVGPLGQIASTIGRSQQALQSLRMLNRIMALPRESDDQIRHIGKTIKSGSIEFDSVGFEYPGAGTSALEDFTLKIEPGERVGIIGKVGSGKTTVGRLIARLYVPTSGTLLLDGVDIRQYHPSEVRRSVALVAQDAVLFHGSVRDNIVLGAPHVSDDAVVRAAELAGVAEFVKTHPQGYNMPVGEAGRQLSSGQRQAVALARAFVAHPAIVFLDEPSGAMDMASERTLLDKLRASIAADQTLILTTHRSAMLSLIDRLVVLENKRVVADGPREEVMAKLRAKATQKPTEVKRIAMQKPVVSKTSDGGPPKVAKADGYGEVAADTQAKPAVKSVSQSKNTASNGNEPTSSIPESSAEPGESDEKSPKSA